MTQLNIDEKKQEVLQFLNQHPEIAVVGRVEDWLKSPESRYPVSCTVLSVEDSMEGENGIEYSWLYVSKALRYAAGVALDLSKLRPSGSDNGRGLVSSGPVSFMTLYSKQNEVLRRGGVFKNGAVVVYLDASHPDLVEYLNVYASEVPWIKRAVYIDDNPGSDDYILKNPHLDLILSKVADGTLWLAKKRWYSPTLKQAVSYPVNPDDVWENRLLSQVCTEILLRSNATCLLSHQNLGMCTLDTLESAAENTMHLLCRLHGITGAGKDNYYLSPESDRQVGMGVIGLANFLANNGVTYKEFADCLYEYMNDKLIRKTGFLDILDDVWKTNYSPKVLELVEALFSAFRAAAKVAQAYGMERCFTIAPTASCSFRYKDINGYTTTPEISPPICHPETKRTMRDSDTFGVQEYQYPLNVETAAEVGWQTYSKLVYAWQLLMDYEGMAHAISFNIWDTCPCDMNWFLEWLESPAVTTYYRMLVTQDFIDKSTIDTGGVDLISSTEDFFIPEDDGSEEDSFFSFLKTATSSYDSSKDEVGSMCTIDNAGRCSACEE